MSILVNVPTLVKIWSMRGFSETDISMLEILNELKQFLVSCEWLHSSLNTFCRCLGFNYINSVALFCFFWRFFLALVPLYSLVTCKKEGQKDCKTFAVVLLLCRACWSKNLSGQHLAFFSYQTTTTSFSSTITERPALSAKRCQKTLRSASFAALSSVSKASAVNSRVPVNVFW